MISIIVPVYNVEAYLVECLESLLAQTGVELEIILVDDGSTDGSLAICQAYAERHRNIKLISQTNQGQSVARNVGLDHAKGDYIFFIDSDDYLIENHALADVLDVLVAEQADIVNMSYRWIYPDKSVDRPFCDEVIDGRIALTYQLTNKIPGMIGGRLFRREVIGDSRFPVGRIAEDSLFSYLTTKRSRKIVVSSQIYYAYRRWDGSTTHRLNHSVFDVLEMKKEVFDLIVSNFPEFSTYEVAYLAPAVINLKNRIQLASQVPRDLQVGIDRYFYTYFPKLLWAPHIRLKTKLNAILTAVNLSNAVRRFLGQ